MSIQGYSYKTDFVSQGPVSWDWESSVSQVISSSPDNSDSSPTPDDPLAPDYSLLLPDQDFFPSLRPMSSSSSLKCPGAPNKLTSKLKRRNSISEEQQQKVNNLFGSLDQFSSPKKLSKLSFSSNPPSAGIDSLSLSTAEFASPITKMTESLSWSLTPPRPSLSSTFSSPMKSSSLLRTPPSSNRRMCNLFGIPQREEELKVQPKPKLIPVAINKCETTSEGGLGLCVSLNGTSIPVNLRGIGNYHKVYEFNSNKGKNPDGVLNLNPDPANPEASNVFRYSEVVFKFPLDIPVQGGGNAKSTGIRDEKSAKYYADPAIQSALAENGIYINLPIINPNPEAEGGNFIIQRKMMNSVKEICEGWRGKNIPIDQLTPLAQQMLRSIKNEIRIAFETGSPRIDDMRPDNFIYVIDENGRVRLYLIDIEVLDDEKLGILKSKMEKRGLVEIFKQINEWANGNQFVHNYLYEGMPSDSLEFIRASEAVRARKQVGQHHTPIKV